MTAPRVWPLAHLLRDPPLDRPAEDRPTEPEREEPDRDVAPREALLLLPPRLDTLGRDGLLRGRLEMLREELRDRLETPLRDELLGRRLEVLLEELRDRLETPLRDDLLDGRLKVLVREALADPLPRPRLGLLNGRLDTLPLLRDEPPEGRVDEVPRGRLEAPLRIRLLGVRPAALLRGRARAAEPDRVGAPESVPREVEERRDGDAARPLAPPLPLDPIQDRLLLEVDGVPRRDVVVDRRRAWPGRPRLADTAAAVVPGALRERARADEPVRALVATPTPERRVAPALAPRAAELPKPPRGIGIAEARPELRDDPPGRGRALATLGTAVLPANAAPARLGRAWIESATRSPATPLGSTR